MLNRGQREGFGAAIRDKNLECQPRLVKAIHALPTCWQGLLNIGSLIRRLYPPQKLDSDPPKAAVFARKPPPVLTAMVCFFLAFRIREHLLSMELDKNGVISETTSRSCHYSLFQLKNMAMSIASVGSLQWAVNRSILFPNSPAWCFLRLRPVVSWIVCLHIGAGSMVFQRGFASGRSLRS